VRELALHILDITENSVSAGAQNIAIRVVEDYVADRLSIDVQDDGKGMDAETVAQVIDPFVTSRTTRKVGLGIPLLKAAAEMCNGELTIDSTPGLGTRVAVNFQDSHIDRMPLGDLSDTFLTLLVAHPEIHWNFDYQVIAPSPLDQSDIFQPQDTVSVQEFSFDDQTVKETLEDIPLSDPFVIAYLRQVFQDGIQEVGRIMDKEKYK
jgi:hypothetical protein